ncbi:MAG: PPK2 family polyphosphate kinase, partial [Pirellulaceae bacterium]
MPEAFTLKPGEVCDLDKIASRVDTDEYDKKSAYQKIAANAEEMALMARKLYAENRRSLLIVLQAMDAAGKDSTVRTVTRGMNPRSCQVSSFKKPSEEELDHDFLWRVHKVVPRRGNVGIFNRSHYEDVLVVRVHDLVPAEVWSSRYDQINDFENRLYKNGTTIIKCYLHISEDEQRERLQARIDNPDAHWKVNLQDLEERKLWSSYREAFNDAITKCNTEYAPWY